MQHSSWSHRGGGAASEEPGSEPSPTPPTATIPALHFGASAGRPAAMTAPTASAGTEDDTGSSAHHSSGSNAGEHHSHSEEEEEEEEVAAVEDAGQAGVAEAAPPALRRPSSLFDSPLTMDALFARLRRRDEQQQQQQQQQRRSLDPPPPPRMASAEAAVPRASVPISSVLGRPPPAPPTPAAAEARVFASSSSAQLAQSASSSPPRWPSLFRATQRSASPTSTVDYVDIEHKQNELRYAVDHHIQSLEQALAMRDEEVATLSSRLRKLEEDYQFNFNLIAERDAALEEAAAQLQRLYRELKRLTEEAARTGKKVDVAEAELRAARQRVRDVEDERDAAVRQVQKDYTVKERHLFDGLRAKEAALEQEQREQHQWYKEQLKSLEEERTAMADRSTSISLEAEERCRQQVGRLQAELADLQRDLKAVRHAKAEGDRHVAELTDTKAALLHDAEVQRQRHEAAADEWALAKKELEDRLTRVVADAEKRTAAAETAAREESARASRAELERTRLQATLAETQERLQHLTTQHDDDIARYTKERQALLRRGDDADAAAALVEQTLQDTQRELEKQRRLAAEEAERLGRELERARGAHDDVRQELVVAEERCAKWEAQVERLEAEVRRWKSEEDKTAASGRQERSAWEERCRQAERQAQLLEEEMQQFKMSCQTAAEKAQAEVARLTRELHASEAARRTLEDQFHLLDDFQEERNTLQTLRMEKEQLQRQMTELEHTNEQVRQQVAAFTAELQNDPILKAAKESQQRIVELQQALSEAQAEQQLLRDAVKEKEEEVVRYQTEMLRVQVLMGDDASAATAGADTHAVDGPSLAFHSADIGGGGGDGPLALSDRVSRALQRQQRQMRAEYSKMRESYEEMVRELERQRRRRGRKPAAASRSSSSSSASTTSETSSTTTSPANSVSGKEHRSRHRHSRRVGDGDRNTEARTASAPLPPVLPDSKAAHLMQEMEVWRQRCVQLEQQLHTILRERDRLRKELQLAKQDVVALGTEKQSLIDLNSLLKVQLREAYRMRGGDGVVRERLATNSGAAVHSPSSLPAAAAAGASVGASSSKEVRISPELLAAALQALEENARGGRGATPSLPQRSEMAGFSTTYGAEVGDSPHTASPANARDVPVVSSTRGVAHSAGAAASRSGFTAPTAQERLAALEREIGDVRGQLSATQTPQQARQPVVRRGTAAVRHYGYGG